MPGLRELAEQDLGFILETDESGFRWPVTVTDPAGLTVNSLYGFSDDIGQIIDPDTGEAVSGRLASVALRISTLVASGFTTLPRGIEDMASKPWIVQFDDINGNPFVFKVRHSNPDRALGLITCELELYEP